LSNNTFKIDILSLGISQIYLNQRKIQEIESWFDITHTDSYSPLPVKDFGNGRYTLTDGHSRAYVAFQKGLKHIWVSLDKDVIVCNEVGQRIYRTAISWCDRFSIHTIKDLEQRIISDAMFHELWVKRCDRMYTLITTKFRMLPAQENMHLYGVEKDLSVFYYEDNVGNLYKLSHGKMIRE
jgi:hypothetical protein